MTISTEHTIHAPIKSQTIYIIITVIIIIVIIIYLVTYSLVFIPNLCILTSQFIQQLADGGSSVLSKRSPVTVW